MNDSREACSKCGYMEGELMKAWIQGHTRGRLDELKALRASYENSVHALPWLTAWLEANILAVEEELREGKKEDSTKEKTACTQHQVRFTKRKSPQSPTR